MTCRERREQIYLLAGGALDAHERTEVEAHLATGCPACEEALAEAQDDLAALVLSLDPVAPPERVRERLLARAREEAPAAAPQRSRAHHPRAMRELGGRLRPAALAALTGAALVCVAGWWTVVRPLATDRERLGAEYTALAEAHAEAQGELEAARRDLEEQDEELAALESRVESAAQELGLLSAREVTTITLAGSEARADAWGRVFWDRDYRCYFRAQGLAALSPERRYVLWMIAPDDRVHAAASFEPDGNGDATVYTRLPRDFRPVVRTLVTEEAEPHGERPSGPVLLAGRARP